MKGDNRIMKTSIALMALSIPVAAYSATAHRDPRTREFVDPVCIVATSHGLEGADILSSPVKAQAIRLAVRLRKDYSGGVLECRVK